MWAGFYGWRVRGVMGLRLYRREGLRMHPRTDAEHPTGRGTSAFGGSVAEQRMWTVSLIDEAPCWRVKTDRVSDTTRCADGQMNAPIQ